MLSTFIETHQFSQSSIHLKVFISSSIFHISISFYWSQVRLHYQGSYASGKLKFFQGQGIVREFYYLSGKNEILSKCQGSVREFYISVR